MKHVDLRILWLQDLIAAGGVRLKKIPRTQNLADMLTHTPGAKELEVFLPLMGLRCCSERDKELMVKTVQTGSDLECESVLTWIEFIGVRGFDALG